MRDQIVQLEGDTTTLTPSSTREYSRRRLRISFVVSVFPPEPEPSGVMAAELARALVQDGHQVTMIVPFPNRPKGVTYPGYRRALWKTEVWQGIRLIRCPNHLIGPRRFVWNRLLENLSFGIAGAVNLAFRKSPDVAILETWPLLATELCLLTARIRKTPVVYYVKDVYPEAAEQVALLKRSGGLANLFRAWDSHIAHQSQKVVVISESMRNLLIRSRGLPPDRIAVVRDWVQVEKFPEFPRINSWRREMALSPDLFVLMFAGTLGLVSGADILIESAKLLKGHPRVLVLCVGEGVLKERMRQEVEREGLANLRFEPFQPRSRVPEMLASADAFALPMRPGYAEASVPSKFISYIAAGRPILCAAPADHEVSKAVIRAKAGLMVPPGDAGALAGAVLQLASDPESATRMGRNARNSFEKDWTFGPRYREFTNLLEELTSMRGSIR